MMPKNGNGNRSHLKQRTNSSTSINKTSSSSGNSGSSSYSSSSPTRSSSSSTTRMNRPPRSKHHGGGGGVVVVGGGDTSIASSPNSSSGCPSTVEPFSSSDDNDDDCDRRRRRRRRRRPLPLPLPLPAPLLLVKDKAAAPATSRSSSAIRAALGRRCAGTSSNLSSLWLSSPPELWKAYLLKFLDSYSYFSFSLVFTLFLSDEFGMTDVQAGSVYGAWGALITIFGLITGTIIDNLGVATCLRMGSALSLLARIALFLTSSTRVLLACLLVALPLGQCLGIPVLTVGVRRYTTTENRGFAFGLYYVVMNVGALVAGMLVDALTAHYRRGGEGGSYHGHGGGGGGSGDGGGGDDDSSFDDNDDDDNDVNDRMLAQDDASSTPSSSSSSDWAMTANRAIILSGVVANLAAVLVAFTVREIKVDDSGGGGGGGGGAGSSNANSNDDVVDDDDDDGDHSNCRDDDDDGMGCPAAAADDDGDDDDKKDGRSSGRGAPTNGVVGVSKFRPIRGSSFQILSETMRTPNFRRFLLVCLLTINVRMVFRHL